MADPLRVLIGCESSGVMRRAFAARGHDAWSCDLLPADDGSNHHIRGDVRDHLADGWDLLVVAHPPCTRLCNSGVRWLHSPPAGRTLGDMWRELDDGVALFAACWLPEIAALIEAADMVLDAFCVLEDSEQIAAHDALIAALRAIAGGDA